MQRQPPKPTTPVTGDENLDTPSLGGEGRSKPARIGTEASRWLAAAGIVIVVAVGTIAFFSVEVCEQQLSTKGTVVQVCRHLQGADPPAIAFGFVLLALFSVFFTEISAFGMTAKRQITALQDHQSATDRIVVRNREAITDTSQHAAELGQAVKDLRDQPGDAVAEVPRERSKLDDPLMTLAEKYNDIRLTMPSGNARTKRMTDVVSEMISALRSRDDFDAVAWLGSDDRGMRLAAYASLYDRPSPGSSIALVDAIIKEDKPFGQYWALRALRNQCRDDPSAIDRNTRRRLERDLAPKLPPGSDRAVELSAVLDTCE
jgi:hypothetical protein